MPARVRRTHKEYDDIHELNGERNNNHWRHSYGLIAERSSADDFLGAEGGPDPRKVDTAGVRPERSTHSKTRKAR